MPVISPAAYTPGVLVSWPPSTATKRPAVRSHPAAIASSSRGVKPWLTQIASAAMVRSVPGIG